MEFSFDTEAQNRVWAVMERINDAWVSGQPDKIALLLHPDCVMTMPDAHQTLHGRDKVVQSYVAYTRMAETTRFTVLQANVDLFGDAAMVTTVFEMTYVLQEKTYKGAGRDIWLFKHSDGAWRGAWRSLADMYEEEE